MVYASEKQQVLHGSDPNGLPSLIVEGMPVSNSPRHWFCLKIAPKSLEKFTVTFVVATGIAWKSFTKVRASSGSDGIAVSQPTAGFPASGGVRSCTA